MSGRCGCCTGTEARTPRAVANRPGLPALDYRVGTHASFLETMKAALSRHDLPALARLTTRSPDDPSIAWLDAWATIADVLTFYQERIANEGFLRTAVERRSVLELARLIGYSLKPGVASSVFLAYTLENGHEVVIPAGGRAQSVPGPGELPQSFETSEDLLARSDWNILDVRLARPQVLEPRSKVVYVKGASANLKSGDRLLFVARGRPLTDDGVAVAPRVVEAVVEPALDRTRVVLELVESAPGEPGPAPSFQLMRELTRKLTQAPSKPPPAAAYLQRSRQALFAEGADTIPRLLGSLHPEARSTLYSALAHASVGDPPQVEVYALRTRAALFGHNAPKRPVIVGSDGRAFRGDGEWPLNGITVTGPKLELSIVFVTPSIEGHAQVAVQGRLGDRAFKGGGAFAEGREFDLGEFGTVTIHEAREHRVELVIQFRDSKSTLTVAIEDRDISVAGTGAHGTLAVSEPVITVEGSTTTIDMVGVWQKVQRGGPTESGDSISLDAAYPRIVEGSWVVIERPDTTLAAKVKKVTERSRADYGLTGRSTVIELGLRDDETWLKPGDAFDVIRRTSVLAESERLELADEPYDRPVSGRQIELAELYGRLEAGRWLIVAGERTDVEGTSGVQAAELVMLASVVHDVSTIEGRPLSDDPDAVDVTGIVKAGRLVPGDRVHSFIGLSTDLAYKYKRDTVRVYGNVVHATHGETRHEILGAGDATRPFLAFPLKQTPLTYVSAPTTSGVTSTLEVRVNEVRWDEADRFAGLEPTDWRFIVRTDDEGGTSVVFGNGGEGARPPTGTENISARYRSGIGRPGNVKARQITLLASRPLGVKDVVNPLPATGGTDREARDEARRNAPLAVLALDHLVSVQDYADFARTFGGIAKAASARLYAGRQALVHVTISGQGETRIDETSDVYRNLSLALHRFGDPTLPVKVGVRALRMLVVQARVRVADAYLWELVEPNVRAAMLVAFGFDRRELGQDVSASEVLRVMQAVPGVHHVDLDLLTSLPEDFTQDDLSALAGPSPPLAHHRRIPARLARVENGAIFPAELIVSSPLVPETLLLSEIER